MMFFKKRIKNKDDIEIELNLKLLASIPIKELKNKETNKLNLISDENEKNDIFKAFKKLRINIQFLNFNNDNQKIILVTSPGNLEGKSYIASNIAISFAKVGKKVILIDTDMNNGNQSKIFNIPNDLGLSNYLSDLDDNGIETNDFLNTYINETDIRKLNIITSGTVPPNSSELLKSPKIEELIKDLNVFYDIIIIDGTSILTTTDALILSKIVNQIILVTEYDTTKKIDLEKAKQDIQNVSGKILGVVLNKVKTKSSIKQYLKIFKKSFKNKINQIKKYINKKIHISKQKLLTEKTTTNKQSDEKININKNKKHFFNISKKQINEVENDNKKQIDLNKKEDKEFEKKEKIELNQENLDKEDYFNENTVLVIVDAESAFCRVFSKHNFVEKLVRNLNGYVKPQYSLTRIHKKHERLRNKYNLTKKQVKRVDPLIYNTLHAYDEKVWKEKGMKTNKANEYINCITKEYTKLNKEKKNQYLVRCQRLRKLELAKSELEIEYKLDNLWFSNKMKFIDKLSMNKFAKLFEVNTKMKNDYEIKKSQSNKDFYKDIITAADNNLEDNLYPKTKRNKDLL